MINEPLQRLKDLYEQTEEYGFSWPDTETLLAQIRSECAEVSAAIEEQEGPERIQEEVADLLHAVCALCFFKKYDMPNLMRKSADKLNRRFTLLKQLAERQGLYNLKDQPYEMMMQLWDEVKILEKIPETHSE
ncbi:MAG: MazG nucleotide pyrophosphohydrolase domain-containing protein [Pseudomonadota bacterium]